MLFHASGIEKSFLLAKSEKRKILSGIDFQLSEEEILCIMGPSGGGKSTLLKILAGILEADSGKILFEGVPIHQIDYRAHISFIFQDYKLIPHLTVFENVALALRLKADRRWKEKAMEALEYVKIAHLSNEYPERMSGGENQRVGIARAISIAPKIIFADEPTGNLDKKTRSEILDLFMRIKKDSQTSFVIVSHDIALKQFSDKIFYMSEGLLKEEENV